MRRALFNQYVKEAAFKEMFITEMGWNRFRGQAELAPIIIDDNEYRFTTVAERNGFQILTCPVDDIPNTTICHRIDSKLRRNANDYVCVFYIPGTEHQQWIAPIKTVEKRDIVTIEYETADKADFLFSKIPDLSFDVEEQTTIVDVKERIQGAFAVNSEKITKDFYTGFRKEHNAFAEFITGIDDQIPTSKNRDKQWYTSVMLNRLMFCYFIQKKGFLDGNFDYLQEKLKWVQRERGENRFFKTFYRGFLSELFHGGLNSPRHSDEFENVYGRIPYLNGGMFEQHQLESDYADIDIDDEAFVRLFRFFDTWRWHLDTRITASGKDINPDVLGYIFEQYINDRAQMGAYYTKEDITEYIGKNCIIPFLMDKVAETSPEAFKADGYVWRTLRESGDRYVYDAVKKGYTSDWKERIPTNIAKGLDTTKPNLLERRKDWNTKTPEAFALPTEIWRETVERLQRCENILTKIKKGEITRINDFITYNLDIRSFAYDLLQQADDRLFILHFYKVLQRVTVLDPTCGSGAFLFAAMNILEPLYEVCIERMQEFNAQNPNWFKPELEEIAHKYRSNIQYFIYKSIILRNLYGVDIMVEATEIAKLRLFLKMMAVVEVDFRADNLGLDPLPDIDFNIRCGNTLVGYATEEELNKDLTWGDMFANQEFKEKVETEMQLVATAYETFKHVQFTQSEDMATFKQAKRGLNERLAALNGLLNRRLHKATTSMPYEDWLTSHQPFHWLAEFYQVIHDNGGFDVIIGNPPYVVYVDAKYQYRINTSYQTKNCANLYAFCIERSQNLLNAEGRFGMIVPNSSISASKMSILQEMITNRKEAWISNYAWRPSKLFEGADMLLAIIITTKSMFTQTHSTIYHKWYNEYRTYLFKCLYYTDVTKIRKVGSIPKIPSLVAISILDEVKNKSKNHTLSESFKEISDSFCFYFRAVQYWFKVLDTEPIFEEDGIQKVTGEMKAIYTENEDEKYVIVAVLSSNLFFLHYIIWSSCQVVNSRDFTLGFQLKDLSERTKTQLSALGKKLQADYQKYSQLRVRNYSKKGRLFTMKKQHFYIKYSKPTIDEIDKVLTQYYGFTEEELDFIINYDIKYRMGDELEKED